MPLVVICGRPQVGKSSVAALLAEYLVACGIQQDNVAVIDHIGSFAQDRNVGFKHSGAEKMGRAHLKGAVERSLTKDRVVIVDGLNYIKGYRYELYCIVRAVGTTHCCVWVDTPHSAAKVRNDSAGDAGYDTKMFEELWLRFEPPDPRNRWDAPMIKVFGSIGDADGALPSVQIAGGVVGGRRAPAFTSKFIGTVVSTPEALAAAEAVAGTVISSSGSSFAGGASPVAAVPTLDVSPAAAAVPKKSAFKRAQPAAPAPVASNVMTGPDTEVDAPPADALPSDADADGLDGLGDLVGGDAAEEADVEAARQRIAALAVQAQAAQSWHVSRRQADSNDVGLPETPAAAGLLQGQPHDRQEACRAVRAALFSRRGYKPPLAVLAVSAAPANYVSEVDTRSAAIMEHLTSSLATRGAITGDVIAVPGSAVPFAVRRMVTPLELKRLKREFERTCAADPAGGVELVATRFVTFLNGHLRT